MIKAAIEKILELAKIEIIEHEGEKLSNKELYPLFIDKAPQPDILKINTLSGIIDYVKIHPDCAKEYLIHIESPKKVLVYGEYEEIHGRRKLYLQSECVQKKDFLVISSFEQIEFITKLQTLFILDDNLRNLINIVSNITDEQTNNLIEDGISQQVIIKKGIKRETKDIINPVVLRPYRTFEEIEQPESFFIFKIIKNENQIKFNLNMIEDNYWILDAIRFINEYLFLNIKEKELNKNIPINIIC